MFLCYKETVLPISRLHLLNSFKLVFFICALLSQYKSAAITRFNSAVPSDTIKTISGNKTELKVLYKDGSVKEIIKLKNNKKHGMQKKYSNTGVLLSAIEYNNGLLCGDYIQYNGQGGVEVQKTYQCNPKLNKSWLEGNYLEYNGKILITKGEYKDSLKQGKWVIYHNNGLLKEIANYKKGALYGEQIIYNNKGDISYKINYIQAIEKGKTIALKHGKYVYYHHSGGLSQEGMYENGNKSGLWKEYSQKGELQKETFYKNGKTHGKNNRYTSEGKTESTGEFYEEIEVDGKILRNVFHGVKEQYNSNGKLERKEKYVYGKKDGEWTTYHANGNLNESASYKNNLQTGKHLFYDAEGNKIYEGNYTIIKTDSIELSVKTGPEWRWEKNVLTFETNYTNGKEQGLRKSYYKSGKVASVSTFTDDLLQGEEIEYYENGNIKNKRNYYSFFTPSKEKKMNQTGWSLHYAEDGKLLQKTYYDSTATMAVQYNYNNGNLLQFSIAKVIEVSYFPKGQLLSEKIISQYANMPFARYYYMNGNIRKISFQNAENFQYNTLHFTSDGKLHFASSGFYNKPDTLLPAQYLISSILNAAGTKYEPNKLYTDSIKNGAYTLRYKNGKVYAQLNFKNDLPHGSFLFYHPETNDTMLYAEFKEGYLHGAYEEKYGGKHLWTRGMYCHHKQCGTWTRNQTNGKAYEIRGYNAITGQTNALTEFYPNGMLKNYNNYESKAYESRDEAGNIISKTSVIDAVRKLSKTENYYPGSKVLKNRSYYRNQVQDSITEGYYPSGALQSKMSYKNGKRNGTYIEYFENGTLKRKSNYENDKLEGMAVVISEKGVADTLYYRNNNMQVKPAAFPCACIDTTHSTSRTGFAPMLNHLVDYPTLESYIEKYLIPVDSLNYKSVFYTGFQNSNSQHSGFSSMNLMMFKEFALRLPSTEQLKLILNPCITKGYVSRMEISASYGIGNKDYTSVDLYPKRIALEFLKGPVKSNDANYKNFKALFDTKNITYNSKEKLKITTKNEDRNCFVPATLKDYININVTLAKPLIFEQVNQFELAQYAIKLTANEVESFFGIVSNKAEISIHYTSESGKQRLKGSSPFLMLGGQYACGVVKIKCTKQKEDVFSANDNQLLFSIEQLKKELKSKGFERLNFEFHEDVQELWFTFFTE